MSISAIEINVPNAIDVIVTDDTLSVELSDGRTISTPLAWYPRLVHAEPSERSKWRLIGQGEGIHWEAIDEDLSVEGLLRGAEGADSGDAYVFVKPGVYDFCVQYTKEGWRPVAQVVVKYLPQTCRFEVTARQCPWAEE